MLATILQIKSYQKFSNYRIDSETVDIRDKIKTDLRFASRLEIQGKVSVDIRNEFLAIHMVYDEQQNFFKAD